MIGCVILLSFFSDLINSLIFSICVCIAESGSGLPNCLLLLKTLFNILGCLILNAGSLMVSLFDSVTPLDIFFLTLKIL